MRKSRSNGKRDGLGRSSSFQKPAAFSPMQRWSQACFLPAADQLSAEESYRLMNMDGGLMVFDQPSSDLVD